MLVNKSMIFNFHTPNNENHKSAGKVVEKCMKKATFLRADFQKGLAYIDKAPYFSWHNNGAASYRLIVSGSIENAKNGHGDMWDSGKIASMLSTDVLYGGKAFEAMSVYYWRVKLWDKAGSESEWSEISVMETGPMKSSDWYGNWVAGSTSRANHREAINPVCYQFRNEFEVCEDVEFARLYICGVGFYKAFINGTLINYSLDPPFTAYDKRVLYQCYSVKRFLQKGSNAIGVMLGNGWYNDACETDWFFNNAPWRGTPRFIAQLYIKYANGKEKINASSESWKTYESPIVFNQLRNGEYYDARLEQDGWASAGFDDSNWENAKVTPPPGGRLQIQKMPSIKVCARQQPQKLWNVGNGVVYDFGRNIAGWAEITVKGRKGDTIRLQYSELIDESGLPDTSNIDCYIRTGTVQMDKYILRTNEIETWQPSFVYHGFRYIYVESDAEILDITACEAHTSLERTGLFESGDETLNKLQKCILMSTLSNYHGIPTDCPHREKNGWTGDAHMSAEQVLLNFDALSSYRKWMDDFRDAQRPSGQLPGIIPTSGWGYDFLNGPTFDSAIILIPWYTYRYWGTAVLLRENYEAMKAYIDYMLGMSRGYIVSFGLGDWCYPDGFDQYICPEALTDTAYFYSNTVKMAEISQILKKNDESYFYDLAREIKQAFRKRFFEESPQEIESQTALGTILYHELNNENEKEVLLHKLIEKIKEADGHIYCGFIGTKAVMEALSKNERSDIIYKALLKDDFPGWGYMLAKGATTLWETWNGEGSQNHHLWSFIGAWMYTYLTDSKLLGDYECFKQIHYVRAKWETLTNILEAENVWS